MEIVNSILGTSIESNWFDWMIIIWVAVEAIIAMIVLFCSFRALFLINRIIHGKK